MQSLSDFFVLFWLGVLKFGNVMACTLSSKMREKTASLFPSSVPLPPFSLCTRSPLKKSDYSVNPIKLKLKLTNILVKFSQKNILFINFLCLEIFQTLVYFFCLEIFQTLVYFLGVHYVRDIAITYW